MFRVAYVCTDKDATPKQVLSYTARGQALMFPSTLVAAGQQRQVGLSDAPNQWLNLITYTKFILGKKRQDVIARDVDACVWEGLEGEEKKEAVHMAYLQKMSKVVNAELRYNEDGNIRIKPAKLDSIGKFAPALSCYAPGVPECLYHFWHAQTGLTPVPVSGAGEEEWLSAEQVSCEFIKTVAESIKREYGHDNTDNTYWVITVPAHFNENQKEATRAAAHLAGISRDRRHLSLLSEPVAAAIAHTRSMPVPPLGLVMVGDMGGGTTDVSLVLYERLFACEMFREVVVKGDGNLGGNDFDSVLRELVAEKLTAAGYEYDKNARIDVEVMKCELGRLDSCSIGVLVGNSLVNVAVSRVEFHDRCQSLIERVRGLVRDAVAAIPQPSSSEDPDDDDDDDDDDLDEIDSKRPKLNHSTARVTDVVMCGGSSALLLFQDTMKQEAEKLDANVITMKDYQNAIAIGASIHAMNLYGPGAGSTIATQVSTQHLYLRLTDKFGRNPRLDRLIEAQTTQPCEVTRNLVTTCVEARGGVFKTDIKLIQGMLDDDTQMLSGNSEIGVFVIETYRPAVHFTLCVKVAALGEISAIARAKQEGGFKNGDVITCSWNPRG